VAQRLPFSDMAMKQRKGPLALLGTTLVHHPARIPETFIVLLLPVMLGWVGWHAGGDVETGTGMLGAAFFSFFVAALWALWWPLKGQGVELSKGVLWTLPLILYLGLHSFVFASAPWRAVPLFGAVFMAWLAYAVVAHMARQRALLYLLVGLTLAVVFGLGIFLFAFDPPQIGTEDLDGAIVEVDPSTVQFGVFQLAPPMLFGWLLTLPFAMVAVALPRFPGYLRIALGGYLLFGVHQLGIVGNLAGYLTFALILLALPFFLRPRWRARVRVYGVTVGLLALVAAVSYLAVGMREKAEAARDLQPALVETTRWSAALAGSRFATITGIGLGALPLLVEGASVAPAGDDPAGTRQTTLQWLAETGLLGLVLSLLAVWGVGGRLFLAWLREPFYPRDREAEFRHARGPGEDKPVAHRSRRRRHHRLKRSTTRKVFLGGLVLGLVACLFFAQFESSWQVGFPLLLLGIWAGVGERFLVEGGGTVRLAKRRGALRFLLAGVSCLLAGLCLLFLDRYQANIEVASARQLLKPYIENENLAFESPPGVYEARQAARFALRAEPDHAEAWALLAQTHLLEEAIARVPLEEAGMAAREAAARAVNLYPKSGFFRLLRAQGMAMAGSNPEAVEATFSEAAAAAPRNMDILYEWARYRSFNLDDAAGARELLDRLLAIDPEYEEARRLRRRLEL
jgi:hypothetical protein